VSITCRRTCLDILKKWFDKIVNFHLTRISSGPTESINNLIKRIKHRLWLSELRELSDPSLALLWQTKLASHRIECGALNVTRNVGGRATGSFWLLLSQRLDGDLGYFGVEDCAARSTGVHERSSDGSTHLPTSRETIG
jgi:hypothetical protein